MCSFSANKLKKAMKRKALSNFSEGKLLGEREVDGDAVVGAGGGVG